MKQETMYPTQVEVINAIERWRATSAPDFEIKSVQVMGDSIRRFSVTLSNGTLGLRVGIKVIPGAHVEGWFTADAQVYNLDKRVTWEDDLSVYPDNLQRLMNAFPHNAIVSLDNEDDAYPVGHPVFGYAVIDDDRNIVAFAAHDASDDDEEYNPFLPHGEVVTTDHIMETLTDTESPRIRESWVDDMKEWWA